MKNSSALGHFGSKEGFSLVETMVASAILSTIALSIAMFSARISKTNADLDGTNSAEELHLELARYLRDANKCTTALSGMSLATSPVDVPSIKDSSGSIVYQSGKQVGKATISTMQLSGFAPVSTQAATERGIVQLNLSYTYPKTDGPGTSQPLNRSIGLMITRQISGGKLITQCGALPLAYWYLDTIPNISTSYKSKIGTTPSTQLFDVQGFPISIGDQTAGGTRVIFDDQPGGIKRINTTNNASMSFSMGNGGIHIPILGIQGNKLGIRAKMPYSALLDISQDSPPLASVFPKNALIEMNRGGSQEWAFSLNNGGANLNIKRMSDDGIDDGNFVEYGPLSVKNDPIDTSFKFFVNGTAGGSTGWNQPSDRRLKTDIKKLSDEIPILETLEKLRPVSYHLKTSTDRSLQYGFIAQELQEVFPDLVTEGRDPHHYKAVKQDELVAFLIEAIKAVNESIDSKEKSFDGFLKAFCARHPEEEACL